MALNLTKGSSLNLTKSAPGLSLIEVGCGWEMLSNSMDLDVSVFALDANNKAIESHVIFFNQKASADGSLVHTGDNRQGGTSGVQEAINVSLTSLPANVAQLSIIVTIDKAIERRHNFGLLKNAFLQIKNMEDKSVMCTYDLDAEFNSAISVQIGSLVRTADGHWEFQAVGVGYPDKSFVDIAGAYGL